MYSHYFDCQQPPTFQLLTIQLKLREGVKGQVLPLDFFRSESVGSQDNKTVMKRCIMERLGNQNKTKINIAALVTLAVLHQN